MDVMLRECGNAASRHLTPFPRLRPPDDRLVASSSLARVRAVARTYGSRALWSTLPADAARASASGGAARAVPTTLPYPFCASAPLLRTSLPSGCCARIARICRPRAIPPGLSYLCLARGGAHPCPFFSFAPRPILPSSPGRRTSHALLCRLVVEGTQRAPCLLLSWCIRIPSLIQDFSGSLAIRRNADAPSEVPPEPIPRLSDQDLLIARHPLDTRELELYLPEPCVLLFTFPTPEFGPELRRSARAPVSYSSLTLRHRLDPAIGVTLQNARTTPPAPSRSMLASSPARLFSHDASTCARVSLHALARRLRVTQPGRSLLQNNYSDALLSHAFFCARGVLVLPGGAPVGFLPAIRPGIQRLRCMMYADGACHGALRPLILAALCIREDALGRRLRMRRALLRAEEEAAHLLKPAVGAPDDVHHSSPLLQCCSLRHARISRSLS
ncbi:hypothetical protein C8J57DRAFT_1581526 [Mycena rebaudengoi]|nr:hypothetical protein C8J57DRAFT_1581526 [Mycena rebaudengoi]